MNKEVMRIIGSGAAEAIPDPFCSCDICSNARITRGREIRSRSCFRVNEGVQIDFGGDQFYQSLVLGNDLTTLENLLITHTHSDHFNFTELGLKEMAIVKDEKPLNIFLSEQGYNWLNKAASLYQDGSFFDNDLFNIVPVKYGRTYYLDDISFVPLKGNHKSYGEGEYSVNYLITLENNKNLYYAVDTGYFLEESFDFLKDQRIDHLVVEGTFGDASIGDKPDGHLSCEGVVSVVKRLLEQGTLNNKSKVYITHINHKHTLTYKKMTDYFNKIDISVEFKVGYDGMEMIK